MGREPPIAQVGFLFTETLKPEPLTIQPYDLGTDSILERDRLGGGKSQSRVDRDGKQ